MAKKAYTTLSMEVIIIETQQMLAASPELGGEYGGGAVLAPELDLDITFED